MECGIKKQLEVIKAQQLKIDKMKDKIIEDFVKENKDVKSLLAYTDEVNKLEELINKTKETYYHTLTEPIKLALLNLARVTKLTATQYGNIIGDIPPNLTKELKMISVLGRVHSLMVEPYVYIGIYNDNFTQFSISGSNALQFALDNFVVDCSRYAVQLEERKQFVIRERAKNIKTFDSRIDKLDEKLLMLKNHKASE